MHHKHWTHFKSHMLLYRHQPVLVCKGRVCHSWGGRIWLVCLPVSAGIWRSFPKLSAAPRGMAPVERRQNEKKLSQVFLHNIFQKFIFGFSDQTSKFCKKKNKLYIVNYFKCRIFIYCLAGYSDLCIFCFYILSYIETIQREICSSLLEQGGLHEIFYYYIL